MMATNIMRLIGIIGLIASLFGFTGLGGPIENNSVEYVILSIFGFAISVAMIASPDICKDASEEEKESWRKFHERS